MKKKIYYGLIVVCVMWAQALLPDIDNATYSLLLAIVWAVAGKELIK